MKSLLNVKYWIFDLDNTLYEGKTKVFSQVSKKMTEFISKKLNVNLIKAKEIQKEYFHEYSTTLNGMIKNHKINPKEFLDFVHNIDLNFLQKDLPLREELKKIKEKKYIYTNASNDHALNVTARLGIEELFDGIFDIETSDFIPKPSVESYKKLISKFKIEPEKSILIEDVARNLKPAKEFGMKTVWIQNNEPWASKHSNEKFIDFKTKKLSDFLKQVNILKSL